MATKSQKPYAFVSFHHTVRSVAGVVRDALDKLGVKAFLAHEDIRVSEEWRREILREIGKADFLIALLTAKYNQSAWCLQEAGIAAFRKITIVPLSLDRTVPSGFIAHLQARNVSDENIGIGDLLPAVAKKFPGPALSAVIEKIGDSGSYRGAEANMELILPHIDKLSEEQMKALLNHIHDNNQIHHASLCASKYVPPLLDSHGHLLKKKQLKFLREVCSKYS